MTIQQMEKAASLSTTSTPLPHSVEIGLELEGRTVVEGSWAARVAGLDDVKIDVAVVRTPTDTAGSG